MFLVVYMRGVIVLCMIVSLDSETVETIAEDSTLTVPRGLLSLLSEHVAIIFIGVSTASVNQCWGIQLKFD